MRVRTHALATKMFADCVAVDCVLTIEPRMLERNIPSKHHVKADVNACEDTRIGGKNAWSSRFCYHRRLCRRRLCPHNLRLTHLHHFHSQQLSQLKDFRANMPHSYCAVMSRTMTIPCVYKCTCTNWEFVSTIRVSNFQYRSGY